jgi:hypothetical protein
MVKFVTAELSTMLPFLLKTVSLCDPAGSERDSEKVLPVPAYLRTPSTHASMFFTDDPPLACTLTGLLAVDPFAGEQITVPVALLGAEH